MSTTIRMTRMGKKHQPLYKVIVKTTRDKRDGKFLEELGFYNPNTNPPVIQLKLDRIREWIKKGSLVSNTVSNLIKRYEKTS